VTTESDKQAESRESVWRLYNELRTAQLNVYYYEAKRRRCTRQSVLLDLVTGLTSSSGIAGLWFWSSGPGRTWWAVFGGLGALSTLLKPALRMVERVSTYEEVVRGYAVLRYDLGRLADKIRKARGFSVDLEQEFEEALDRRRGLIEKEPDRSPDEQLARECQERVNREMPYTSFYDPATRKS